MTKSVGFLFKSVLAMSGILFGLAAGSAMATTVTASSVSLPNGSTTVNIVDTLQSVDGGGSNLITGTIGLQTNIGALSTYCVDLFDYIQTGNPSVNSFNQNVLTAGSHFQNGTATGTFTQAQVNTITALLPTGSLLTQNTLNSAALQIAIWATEYDTTAGNGTYNISSPDSFYFTHTGDSNSQSAINLAQTFLNNVTSGTWITANNHYAPFLNNTTGYLLELV